MNTLAIVIVLAVMVTLATARGYDTYNRNQRSWDLQGSRGLNNGWNSGHLTGSWNSGHLIGGLNGGGRRYRRAATGYGSFDPYRSSHLDSGLGRLNRWGINSGKRSNLGWRSNSRWNQQGY
ncbi:uncharacterized protein LOC127736226 isoform X2 [Mytilus californianus]|uniref:uncharacterized protein LOC127736226 isoform X1 n=1 Tax=Mytilus californianus TaxID=6549 RepID=UPI0022481271|nr:uncharacterized protein LOC127736226 isoform X1 [Mytilus californianus]XP_052102772.1 uncharacterized protein LOC127736226 isoform X2 [Mytilus californianus]